MLVAVVAVHDGIDLLPHFLRHYSQLGVDQILIGAADQCAERVKTICNGNPATVFPFGFTVFDTMEKLATENRILVEFGLDPDDYVMYLDLDEFHEYPAPLAEIIDVMDRENMWAVRGWFLDRVARDGHLYDVTAAPSIWEQFPVGCRITRNLLRAWDQKIMLCRRRVTINAGHHNTTNARYSRKPIEGAYWVHHFKWVNGVIDRLKCRLEKSKLHPSYRRECETLLAYWQKHGHFDLSDRTFDATDLSSSRHDTGKY